MSAASPTNVSQQLCDEGISKIRLCIYVPQFKEHYKYAIRYVYNCRGRRHRVSLHLGIAGRVYATQRPRTAEPATNGQNSAACRDAGSVKQATGITDAISNSAVTGNRVSERRLLRL